MPAFRKTARPLLFSFSAVVAVIGIGVGVRLASPATIVSFPIAHSAVHTAAETTSLIVNKDGLINPYLRSVEVHWNDRQHDVVPFRTAIANQIPAWLGHSNWAGVALEEAVTGRLAPLHQTLMLLASRHDWSIGIAVVDLSTGERIGINATHQFQAASTIKFYVALSTAKDISNGLYTFDNIRRDIELTMVNQSNRAALVLTLKTGIETINQRLQNWGLVDTVFDHPAGYGHGGNDDFSDGDNLTSPSDAIRGLELLYNGRIVDHHLSRVFVENLSRAPNPYGIQGSVSGVNGNAYYKVGWLPSWEGIPANHDIGIVELKRGEVTRAYALAIYNEGAPTQKIVKTFLLNTSRAVWDFFNARYPMPKIEKTGFAS